METNQNDSEVVDGRDIDTPKNTDTDKASIDLYANLIDLSDNKLLFEGKCIVEWNTLLRLPTIPSVIENSDIIKLNQWLLLKKNRKLWRNC